ncbi:hypothetical protein J3L16_00935 [Alteromonas sp. 5E99-2]|uniref:hypothetical protein n=1 Tax=Alteromonas sp. 5E99-2 TaxID=2817683 RepID=UPI001A99A05F|nr:hypothetical protein [Alteromonas sp. 5E99-2]MBO1254243.1 hypothetical protein [Alteromonas sp. 5E99-2]
MLNLTTFNFRFFLIASIVSLLSGLTVSFGESISSYVSLIDKVAILFAGFLVVLRFFNHQRFIPTFPVLPLVFCVLVGLVSSVFSGYFSTATVIQVFLTFQGFLFLYFASQFNYKTAHFESFINALLVLGVISCLLAIIEILIPSTFINVFHAGKIHDEAVIRGSFKSLQSFFSHPGQFSWFLTTCIICCFCLYFKNKRLLYLILGIVFTIFLLLTLRRKSIIALVATLVTIQFFLSSGKKSSIKSYMYLFLLIFGIGFVFNDQLAFLYEDAISKYGSEGSILTNKAPRVLISEASIKIAEDYFPLGTGFGTFGSWMSRVNYSDLYHIYGLSDYWGMTPDDNRFLTDTYWPMIIAEMGYIAAFVLFISIIGFSYSCLIKIKHINSDFRFVFAIAVALFIELVVESFSSPALSRSPQVFIVMGFLGMCLSYYQHNYFCKNAK